LFDIDAQRRFVDVAQDTLKDMHHVQSIEKLVDEDETDGKVEPV
jgi:hypothetical protein